ncbi:DNRLRE domain-containing protein [Cohnella faecalis]|uniref:Fibronectin type III domain-containing protein n=1 Tax=Cohnella faecalis TaxID=2315694 RepID=A0A398CVP2_9BACL|nr:DNRLRE domain-containing protein [Cohnella faecalis]RIE03937.1 fibronectin type III domain-containing protein [Cohnella faecalis]
MFHKLIRIITISAFILFCCAPSLSTNAEELDPASDTSVPLQIPADAELKQPPAIDASTPIFGSDDFNPDKLQAGTEGTSRTRIELIEKRTRNSKQFVLGDGTFQTEYSMTDIHYEDANGQLQDMDTSLIDEDEIELLPNTTLSKEVFNDVEKVKQKKKQGKLDRSETDFMALRLPFSLKLPKKIYKGYSIGHGKEKLTFIPVGVSEASKGVKPADGSKNKLLYAEVWQNTDIELIATSQGVKENIILKSEQSPSQISFELRGNLNDRLSNESLRIMPAWLEDNHGVRRDVIITKRNERDRTYLDLTWDSAQLSYPVTIDPSTEIVDGNDDTFVDSGNPNTSYGDDPLLTVAKLGATNGMYSTYRYKNAYTRFSLSGIPSTGTTITSSVLRTKVISVSDYYQATIQPYRVAQTWNKYTTYSNAPLRVTTNPGSAVNVMQVGGVQYVYFDVTEMTKDSFSGGEISIGLYSVGDNINHTGANVSFASFSYPGGCSCDNVKLIVNWSNSEVPSPSATITSGIAYTTPYPKVTWSYSGTLNQVKYLVTVSKVNGTETYSSQDQLSSANEHTFLSALSEGTWTVKLKVFNGESWSSEVTQTITVNALPTISNFRVDATVENSLTLAWNVSNPYQVKYQIVGMKKGYWETYDSGIVTSSGTSHSVSLLRGEYEFALRVYNGASWTPWSIVNSATVNGKGLVYTYNASNQLSQLESFVTGAKINFQYDNNGNLTKRSISVPPQNTLIADGNPVEWVTRTKLIEDGYDDFINMADKQPERDIRRVYIDQDASYVYLMIELGRVTDYDLLYPHGYNDDNYFVYFPMTGATTYSSVTRNNTSVGTLKAYYEIASWHENDVTVHKYNNGSWQWMWTGTPESDGIGSKRIVNGTKVAASAILELRVPLNQIPGADLSKAFVVAASDTKDVDIAQN